MHQVLPDNTAASRPKRFVCHQFDFFGRNDPGMHWTLAGVRKTNGGGRDARRKQDAFGRHSRLRQDLRVHDDDVGHRYKCREATQHLLFDGGLVFGEFEVTIDQRLPRVELFPMAPGMHGRSTCF